MQGGTSACLQSGSVRKALTKSAPCAASAAATSSPAQLRNRRLSPKFHLARVLDRTYAPGGPAGARLGMRATWAHGEVKAERGPVLGTTLAEPTLFQCAPSPQRGVSRETRRTS